MITAIGRLDRSGATALDVGLLQRSWCLLLGVVVAGTAGYVATYPDSAAIGVAGVAIGLLMVVGTVRLLLRAPWLAPWAALIIFSTSSELRLRVHPGIGLLKDVLVLVLVLVVVSRLLSRGPRALAGTRTLGGVLAAIAVVPALYLLDPAGQHGSSWIFGSRLLMEALALLLVGLLTDRPQRTLQHLVRAMTVVLPLEAAFAWAQRAAGLEALLRGWGYQYGAQVRVTSGGSLRTSGTFDDPFQLAALAVLGLALGLFVAKRGQAVVLLVAGAAALGATSVRTSLVQVAILLLLYAVRRGWWRQALALTAVAVLAGIFLLATITTSVRPGAPETPLLFGLNGRNLAWGQAVQGWESMLIGNGVGALGIGSTRELPLAITPPASHDPAVAPTASFAGDPAFLDSAYAQVQSDVGLAGTIALVGGFVGLAVILLRRCRSGRSDATSWAALAVLAVSMVDWIGRSSLASYATGFLTLYVLGLLLAADQERQIQR
ncbi:hypothetical protein JKP75_00730 [Blastococcus sp. TML/M2B]|uniref:hypothetical protein n=1 Tax=unclassified Blastococcus TaxID=2619396 RepID=UPI00190994FC|nr:MULTISPECIES: hypothetical protein [unclassified Blastococcus]MBN1091248.1 hypothetical protein [Blastococcus sp. TML/M2B]MBN1095195.1 hypothetical protein [Blastococcus sp. TML/C7B]